MRISNSYLWALLIAVAVVGWMFSDNLLSVFADESAIDAEQVAQMEVDAEMQTPNFVVAARKVQNVLTELVVRSSGVTEPTFRQPVLVRRSGVIAKLPAIKGARVGGGDILLELDRGTLASQLVAAKASTDAADKAFKAEKRLLARSLSTELAVANAGATLRNSEVQIDQIKEQRDFTVVHAPRTGYLEELNVKIGEVVTPNQTIGTLIGLDELFLTIPVPQADIARVSKGDLVRANIVGFGSYDGKVHRISHEANAASRTFNVEVLLPNASLELRGGMSSEVGIIVDFVPAFAISPAHLSVIGDGVLGVKVLDAAGRVISKPVALVKTENDLAYITGLSDGDILLTTGQAFLSEGEMVAYELEAGAE